VRIGFGTLLLAGANEPGAGYDEQDLCAACAESCAAVAESCAALAEPPDPGVKASVNVSTIAPRRAVTVTVVVLTSPETLMRSECPTMALIHQRHAIRS